VAGSGEHMAKNVLVCMSEGVCLKVFTLVRPSLLRGPFVLPRPSLLCGPGGTATCLRVCLAAHCPYGLATSRASPQFWLLRQSELAFPCQQTQSPVFM
jgi:hypothetical protein